MGIGEMIEKVEEVRPDCDDLSEIIGKIEKAEIDRRPFFGVSPHHFLTFCVQEGHISNSEGHKLYTSGWRHDEKEAAGGCALAGYGRGDCEHALGLPGKSIPGQHDGPDDTVDVYGKPNGWCWSCWKSHQIQELRDRLRKYESSCTCEQDCPDSDGYCTLGGDDCGPETCFPEDPCEEEIDEMTASEALFGFCAWLTSQNVPVVMSSSHECGSIAGLISTFCKENKLSEPREDWDRRLKHPPDVEEKEVNPYSLGDLAIYAGWWQQEARKALSALSGDLNHGNVAEAKKILQKSLEILSSNQVSMIAYPESE